jgi:signal transduction histidine kinase
LTAAACFGLAMLAARGIGGARLDGIAVLWAGWLIAATLGSEVARGRLEQRRLAEARRLEAQEHQAETLRRQLVEERLRIARDLHDSVAHSMATINVQAGVAAHVIEQRPLAARDALEAIRATSGTLLDELAAMLRLLRADTATGAGPGGDPTGPPAGAEPAPRQPAPDLTRLEALVDSSRLAGLEVELLIGDVRLEEVSPAVSTSAYRIVQEALTNVIRHAGTDRATVAVLRRPEGGLAVEIRDEGRAHAAAGAIPLVPAAAVNGAAPPRAGSGMGLIGIRERAEATGGHVECGPRPAGGFLVRVSWP